MKKIRFVEIQNGKHILMNIENVKKITDVRELFILYPKSDIDNIKKFPGDLNNLPLIYELENSRYTVKAPFGTDTYILITTDTRIPDLKALQMHGVATDVRGNTFDEFTNYITGTNSIKKEETVL